MPKRIFDVIAPIYDFIIRGSGPEELVGLLQLSGKERVLEVGSGTGKNVKVISDHCKSLWLLDPSIPMLRVARNKQQPRVHHVHGYAEKIPFTDGFFDRIFTVDSLHHWDDQYQGLLEVRRVLKPSGLFLLIEFDPSTRKGHFIRSMERVMKMGSTFFTPNQMAKILENIGFKVIKQLYLDSGTYVIISKNSISSFHNNLDNKSESVKF